MKTCKSRLVLKKEEQYTLQQLLFLEGDDTAGNAISSNAPMSIYEGEHERQLPLMVIFLCRKACGRVTVVREGMSGCEV